MREIPGSILGVCVFEKTVTSVKLQIFDHFILFRGIIYIERVLINQLANLTTIRVSRCVPYTFIVASIIFTSELDCLNIEKEHSI